MPKTNPKAPQSPEPAGVGRKRTLLDIPIDRLHLDPQNPRLPEEVQGSSPDVLLQHLAEHFDLEEIADPMAQNGYFDEEPLVVVPIDLPQELIPKIGEAESPTYLKFLEKADFTVAEGNRRLATAKILLSEDLRRKLKIRHWPAITEPVKDDLSLLPAIVYPTRKEVLPYLGVRHITGNKKWDSYAKARYISAMLDEGHSIEAIEREVGDRTQAVLKNAVAYRTLQQAHSELELDITKAKDNFSFMLLGIGQREIKLFLGWSKPIDGAGRVKTLPLDEIPLEAPVPETHLGALRDFLSWVYGEGTKVLPVIKESRDITNYLTHVVASPDAVACLRDTRNLLDAFDVTNGEEMLARKLLRGANSKLEKALGIAHRHKTEEVVAEAEKCFDTAQRVVKTVRENGA